MPSRPAFRLAVTLGVLALAGPALAQADAGLAGDEAVHYGRRLVAETFAYLGPEVADPGMRFAGNNLACQDCHIDAGTRAFGLSLVGVSGKYPQPLAGGGTETLADRINACMTRSMNGRALPGAGPEMAALVAYLRQLTADAGSFGDPVEDPVRMPELARPADPVRGGRLYLAECAACHRADGSGMRNGQPGDALGYLHPPLWGRDSFNDAAGMARLITAANFVHDNMPPGTSEQIPTLPPEDAWDIAAYVESQPRPSLAGLDTEYPDALAKPVDAAYGPYVPGIAPEQYWYGPFQPIRDRIADLKARAAN